MEICWELSPSNSSTATTSIAPSVFVGALDVEAPTFEKDSAYDKEVVNHQLNHYFLNACFLCEKPIAGDTIFMYRDVPFCSDSCRQWQINLNEVLGDDRVLLKSAVDSGGPAPTMKGKPTLIFNQAAFVIV